VANAVNRCLENFVDRCSGGNGVRRYFDIAVIGYGAKLGSAWTGAIAGQDWVSIAEVGDSARVVEITSEQSDGRPVQVPVWLDPVAEGGTPMCQALTRAKGL